MGPGVQEVVEAKLGKLKEKIWEVRMRLGALRDRRKKLLMISARDRMVEYACPCNPGNSTKPERVTEASVHSGEGDSDGDFDPRFGVKLTLSRLTETEVIKAPVI